MCQHETRARVERIITHDRNVSSLMTTTQSCVLVSGHLPAAIVGYTHEEGWYRREKKTEKSTGAQCSRLQTLARDQMAESYNTQQQIKYYHKTTLCLAASGQ
jgi:hypothetical protein